MMSCLLDISQMSCLILLGPHTIIFIPVLQIAHQRSPVYNSSKTLLTWPASQISKSIRVFLLGTASSTPSYSPITTPHVEKENSGLPIGWDCFSILHWHWSFPNNKKSQELCSRLCWSHSYTRGLLLHYHCLFCPTLSAGLSCWDWLSGSGVFGTQIGIIMGDILHTRGPGIKYHGNRRQHCVWVCNKPHKQILQFSVLLAVLVAPCT